MEIKYDIFVESAYGSDVVSYKSLEEARKGAKEWKEDLIKNKSKDKTIAIVKVTEELVEEI